ncbi:MAG: hypothetical protein ACKPGT_18395, partial [Microcystis sp.]
GERLWFASEEIPGWSFHGGYSGSGISEINIIPPQYQYKEGKERIKTDQFGNHVLELGNEFPENTVTHNRFYIPDTEQVQGLKFKYQVKEANPNDQLKVFLIVDQRYELGT